MATAAAFSHIELHAAPRTMWLREGGFESDDHQRYDDKDNALMS